MLLLTLFYWSMNENLTTTTHLIHHTTSTIECILYTSLVYKIRFLNLYINKTIQRNKQKRYPMLHSLCLLKEISTPMKMTKNITTSNLWAKSRWFSWIPNPTFQIWLPNMLYTLLEHQVTFSWETKLVDNYIIYFLFWTTKKSIYLKQ